MAADKQQSTFSTKALAKAVKAQVATHPMTVYPIAAGLGSLVSFGLLSGLSFAWLGGAGLTLGIVAWLVNRFGRYNAFATQHLKRIRKQLRQEREEKLKRIQADLIELNCHAGCKQLEKQKRNYGIFMQVLDEKLNPLEITYGRYLGIVEQVYLATLDNLETVALSLKSVQSIDREYIHKQLKALDENEIDNSDSDYDNLRERLRLLDETNKKVDQLLNENEKAITQLVATTTKLAETNTKGGRSSMAMEDAMGELSYLTKNLVIYDRRVG